MFKGLTKYSLLKFLISNRFNFDTNEVAMHGLYICRVFLPYASFGSSQAYLGKKRKTKCIWWDFEQATYNLKTFLK